ncbi:MAG TPA: hypothetical protein VFU02_11010, partial [Polyangiaceae bacterium]|nr:hypothetical protein [Polyangiaceae bacterium]
MNTDRKPPGKGSSAADVPQGTTPAAPVTTEPVSVGASAEPTSENRPSMAELERELAELLDQAPLLPDDDDEGSGVDFVPPPHLAARTGGSEPPVADVALNAPAPSAAPSPEAPTPAVLPPAAVETSTARAAGGRGERDPAAPAVSRGTRALVTTIVVAAALVVTTLLTWPTKMPDHARPGAGAPSASVPAPRADPAVLAVPVSPDLPSPAPSAQSSGAQAGHPDAGAFSVVDMLTALAPAAIEAGRCRHAREQKGRAHVKVSIAEGGTIESVFAGNAYKDSETAACIERKIRAVKLPPFSGKGGSVVL